MEENQAIELKGVKLSDDFQLFLHDKLNHLEEVLPPHTFIRLVLSQTSDVIRGKLRIRGLTVDLKSFVADTSLPELLFRLFADVEDKISRWKMIRFLMPDEPKKAAG